jgi:hypothetical protein
MTLKRNIIIEVYNINIVTMSDKGKGYRVVVSSSVGGAVQRIDEEYAETPDGDVILRSSETAYFDNKMTYGEEKVFYRWRVKGAELVQVGLRRIRKDGRLIEGVAK